MLITDYYYGLPLLIGDCRLTLGGSADIGFTLRTSPAASATPSPAFAAGEDVEMRYLLIDRIDELKKYEYAVGTKVISLADDCFEHHFPGRPVYPGALLIEAMAQLGGALLELSLRQDGTTDARCVLSSVKAKFREFATPGDVITMRAEVSSRHEESALVHVRGTKDEKRVCEAEIVYVLLRIDDPALENSRRQFLSDVTRTTKFV